MLIKGKFAAPIAKTTVAEDWHARGFSCDEFYDPPGRAWNGYVHRCNELVTVVKGKLEMKLGEEQFLVAPGDEIFIPRGVMHSVKNVASEQTYWLYGYDGD